jgi:hypothetical protein
MDKFKFDTTDYWHWYDCAYMTCWNGGRCKSCQEKLDAGYQLLTDDEKRAIRDFDTVAWGRGKRPPEFHQAMSRLGLTDQFYQPPAIQGYDQPGFSARFIDQAVAEPKMSKDAPLGGCNCTKCNQNNPYAAPNRKDGTYVCYGCR